jgi:GDPmannose 4,6-dehydratase
MSKIAFITGITGQDGSYLAELLLDKSYKVYGIVRRTSLVYSYSRIEHIRNKLNLEYGDLTDGSSITNIIHKIINENTNFEVLEIYNLAAQSHVKISFETPEYTSLVDGIGTLKILEAIRILPQEIQSKIKFYQAGTSEMYGEVRETPQNENTPLNPQSPYACAKVYSHFLVKNYREGYGLYACNGILFNHESDYVYGMWLMMQQEKPDDYVLATGVTTTVQEFIEKAFNYVNIEIEWEGEGEDECGINKEDGTKLVVIDKKYFRPCEVDLLLGDATKAREKLGWKLNYDLDGLIKDMFENEN